MDIKRVKKISSIKFCFSIMAIVLASNNHQLWLHYREQLANILKELEV